MTVIREPAVAGQFYPGDTEELSRTVGFLLDEAMQRDQPAIDVPKAIIAPHAGYIYSGPVAAAAYARLRPHCERYERVILLGPCHRVAVRGLAVSGADAFRTPLGDILLDTAMVRQLRAAGVETSDRAHAFEHCLEVHLPFLQEVLGTFVLVPLVVGRTRPERVSEVLDLVWGGPETLIVISSDLSHYLKYDDARRFDRQTCESIEKLSIDGIDHDHACGATPVNGLLLSAKRHNMRVTTLDLRNSGDTAGDRSAVVGYGAWEFVE